MAEALKAIRWTQEGDVTVVRFTASHIADQGYVQRARKELRVLAERVGDGKMIVSLSNVRFMASVGLGILVELNKLRQESQTRLHVCDMQPMIREVFTSAKIDRLLGIYATKEEAIAAFGKAQQGE